MAEDVAHPAQRRLQELGGIAAPRSFGGDHDVGEDTRRIPNTVKPDSRRVDVGLSDDSVVDDGDQDLALRIDAPAKVPGAGLRGAMRPGVIAKLGRQADLIRPESPNLHIAHRSTPPATGPLLPPSRADRAIETVDWWTTRRDGNI